MQLNNTNAMVMRFTVCMEMIVKSDIYLWITRHNFLCVDSRTRTVLIEHKYSWKNNLISHFTCATYKF